MNENTLKDHQGNLTATVCGNNVERLSYDAWGRRRNPVGFGYGNVTCTFDRGYTLHEHYDDFGLINMNGRMYDPVMSSFLSVDHYVQQPETSQGFNRYAYCMYNPLKYVDPSGWMMTRPNGRGGIPPYFAPNAQPVSVNGGYQLSEIDGVLYGGCLRDVDVTAFAITSSGDMPSNHLSEWSSDRGFGNYGHIDGTLSNSEIKPYTGSSGLGAFWTGGYGAQSKEGGLLSSVISNTVSYAGLITGYKKDCWEKPLSRSQKAINQKEAYNTQKALKAKGVIKSVKDIKATKVINLRTGGHALAGLSIGIEALDMTQSRSCNVSNAIGVLAAIGGAFFWEVSLAYMTIDLGFYLITGQSFGENMDNWVGKPIFSW